MSDPAGLDEVTLSFAGLRIRIARDGYSDEGQDEAASLGSFAVVGSPTSGALAGPAGPLDSQISELRDLGATSSTLVEQPVQRPFGSAAWEAALLAAVTPEDFENLDLSGARRLLSRLRSSPGAWSPAARIERALKCGLVARYQLGFRPAPEVELPAIPLANKVFVVLRGVADKPAGWTDHYPTFRASVYGKTGRVHADAVGHGFASRAEGEAYCLGAERVWPRLLQRLD